MKKNFIWLSVFLLSAYMAGCRVLVEEEVPLTSSQCETTNDWVYRDYYGMKLSSFSDCQGYISSDYLKNTVSEFEVRSNGLIEVRTDYYSGTTPDVRHLWYSRKGEYASLYYDCQFYYKSGTSKAFICYPDDNYDVSSMFFSDPFNDFEEYYLSSIVFENTRCGSNREVTFSRTSKSEYIACSEPLLEELNEFVFLDDSRPSYQPKARKILARKR